MSTLTVPTPSLQGLGLFGGKASSLRILPALTGGVRIESREAPKPGQLHGSLLASAAAHINHVTPDTRWSGLPPGVAIRNTTLALAPREPRDEAPHFAATVEHLLAALAGLNVWNACITLSGSEIPILDGSTLPFVEAIHAQLAPLPASHEPAPLVLRTTITVEHQGASITAGPPPRDGALSYTYELDYGPGAALRPHAATWNGDTDTFVREIAPARTFSLEREARAAHAAGLFTHLSPREMLVVADSGQPIDNAWRIEHEPARHKLLDLIGDLALLGRPLHATVVARKSGHALTHELVRRILSMA
jgi:UDP-3-O-acyl-N-acetylglucosamine deacetylase